MKRVAGLIWLAMGWIWTTHGEPSLFKDPVRLKADGEFIDTEVGHAAPFVGDFDGDGKDELLVGQFGGGKLWVFAKNQETLGKGRLFKDGGPGGTVPTG